MKHYVLKISLLILLAFQSCGVPRQHDVGDETVADTQVAIQEDARRGTWGNLSCVGCPIVPDAIPSIILERYCYTVSYNPSTRQPNWVMWRLDGDHVMKRKEGVWNEFREDIELEPEARSTNNDYDSPLYDRGHMCPGGDCNWDDEGRDETYLLSNICPQHLKLNRGDWKEIETACRKWAERYSSIYVVCGPIFLKSSEHERIGPHKLPVPEAFFKVVLCVGHEQPKGIGFICRNTEGNRKKDFYVNTIREVERVTGYQFFPNLDGSVKDVVWDMDDIGSF